jgi:nitrate/nitrite transporter NarK
VTYESTPTPTSEASEPLFTVGSITAGVTAVIAVLVAFGLPISDGQQSAILGVVAVAAPLAVAALARRRVYAPATVSRLLAGRR